MVSDRAVPEPGSVDDVSGLSLSKTIILVYVQFLQYFLCKTGRGLNIAPQVLPRYNYHSFRGTTRLTRTGLIRRQQGQWTAKGEKTQEQ